MRRFPPAVAILLFMAAAPPAAAQQQPRLVVAAGGGALMGADLWQLPGQLAAAPNLQYDSMRFGRRVDASMMAYASLTYFPREHFGYTAELSFHAIASTGACAPLGPWAFDSQAKNAQACGGIDNGRFGTSLTALQVGIIGRVGNVRGLAPYARLSAGIATLMRSFVQSGALVNDPGACGACILVLVDERSRPSATWVATLAIGNTVYAGDGLGFRLELRDLVASLPVAVDSGTPTYSNPFPYAKTGWRVRHLIGLTLGAEVALERSHRRRY